MDRTVNTKLKLLIRISGHALSICLIILSLYYFWFTIQDRNIIFLYYHDMGPRVPDTSPFSFVTSSRYWMTGLVANGIVFTLYSLYIFIRRRINKDYSPPIWWHTLLYCAPIIITGTFIITMVTNQLILPFAHSFRVVSATLVGLAIGLYSSQLAQKKLLNIVLMGIDGFAVGIMMWISIWVERIDLIPTWKFVIIFKIYAICLVILIITSAIYIWKKIPLKIHDLYILSLAIPYLFGAALHYSCGTDGHFYITDSSNFFIRNNFMQILIWLLALLFVFLIVKTRNSIILRRLTKR